MTPQFLQALAAKITATEFMSASEADSGGTGEIVVKVDSGLDKLGALLQAAFEKHNLNLEDSIQLATLCFQRVYDIPYGEAKALAKEAITKTE